MYEETVLPVRNKIRIPSRTLTRIYFVQDQTQKSLTFLKWIELVLSLLCLSFSIPAGNTAKLTTLVKSIVMVANSSSSILVMIELSYSYFKRAFPLILQVLGPALNLVLYAVASTVIYHTNPTNDLIKTLLLLEGLTTVIFLVDLVCKIIISTYLHQTTRVKTVVDVGVSVFNPSAPQGKPKLYRSSLTATPITYGGTFPVGKDQPPFLPQDRIPPGDGLNTPEKANRHISVQTLQRSKSIIQWQHCQEDKGTPTQPPPFYLEQERRRKSPWTCSTPNSSRKIEARKQTTPITYSGTFAVNKELVPITPGGITGSSPRTSPRNRKPPSRSEGSSPTRPAHEFVDLRLLDQISEEKISSQMSSDNCSLISKSNCGFYQDLGMLPGSTVPDNPTYPII